MSNTLILIVEDEPAIAELVKWALRDGGFECCSVADAMLAWDFILSRRPQLILLDWMLHQQSGLDLLLRIRRERSLQGVPVLMLSGKTLEHDSVACLDSGADDYMTKPFSPRELLARTRALLRRSDYHPQCGALQVANVVLDPLSCSVRIDDARINISASEFRLLQLLMSQPGQAFSRQQLRQCLQLGGAVIDERTVDVHVLRLRRAMRHARGLVKTVRNVGYVLTA
ncbi:MAG: response regulator [Pseudomonadota bacterium]|nr:response regulator [Pseudomonadota bacterium]